MLVAPDLRLVLRLEHEAAPRTCAAFEALLPLRRAVLQARWSGEAAWIPLLTPPWDVPHESATSHPAPGQILLYPGGYSEPEILIAYGATQFSSKLGQLAGNHFLTVIEGLQHLGELGRRVSLEGAQQVEFRRA